MEKSVHQKSFSLRIAFVVVCLMFVILIINVNIEINSLKQDAAKLQEEIRVVDREIERLQIEFEKPVTDETMRQLARDTLGYYQSNEIIYEVS